jgi:hypothetical protein
MAHTALRDQLEERGPAGGIGGQNLWGPLEPHLNGMFEAQLARE